MKARINFSKIVLPLLVVLCLITNDVWGQTIHSGEIVFKRRTNLEKRYEGSGMGAGSPNFKKQLKEPKTDQYVLYFNDTSSLFMPILPEVGEEDREWLTMRNTSYQNFNSGLMDREFDFMGTKIYLSDSVKKREWFITGSERDIAGYNAKQAMWIANDSTKIFAWYADQIVPSVGPESFNGLPGTILGLAIEDGGVVYFAEKVKPLSKPNFLSLVPKGKEKNTYTTKALLEYVDNLMKGRGMSGGRLKDDLIVW